MTNEESLNTEAPKPEAEVQDQAPDSTQDASADANETDTGADQPEGNGTDEVALWKDKYMRLHAEFDNFRKRTIKERGDLLRTASGDVIKAILPVLDDFDRAIAANAADEDLANVKEGFQLIHQKLFNVLSQQGLEPMDSKGKPFDVDEHEALTQIPAPEEDLKGKVVDVVEKGYRLNDAILRYAKVVVGQ